jgi:seryl-tRNA synthetase
MLDIKRIRDQFEDVKTAVMSRGQGDFGLEQVRELDIKRREILMAVEQKKNRQTIDSREIPKLKKEGKDTSALMAEMKELSEAIRKMDGELSVVEDELNLMLLSIPNTPNASVPIGTDESDNVEIRRWGTPREEAFEMEAHWDIGTNLDILDFERGSKIAGARFTVYKGLGARLERSLINFMLNLHTGEHGFTEIRAASQVRRRHVPPAFQRLFPDSHSRGASHQLACPGNLESGRTAGLLYGIHPLLPQRGRIGRA